MIGPLYAQLIARAASVLGFGSPFLDLWPTKPSINEPWSIMEAVIYTSLASLPVLFTAAGQGSWLTTADVIFATEADSRFAVLMLEYGRVA